MSSSGFVISRTDSLASANDSGEGLLRLDTQSVAMNDHIKQQTEKLKAEIHRQKTSNRERQMTESAVLGNNKGSHKRKSSHSFSYTVRPAASVRLRLADLLAWQ